jgi:hypothetical protein
MKYARYLRVTGYVFCGAVVGGVAGIVLSYILLNNGMIRLGKGLEGAFLDLFVGLVVLPLSGVMLGELGGLLVALRTGQRQSSRETDPHLLLKQLLSDPGVSTNGINPSQRS